MDGLGQIEVGPDALWSFFYYNVIFSTRMFRNVKFMISSHSCSMTWQIMCQLRKLISKEEYPDLRESIEFPSNSTGKSHVLGSKSTSVASVVWLCCDITARVKAFNPLYLSNYRDTTRPGIRPPNGITITR